MSALVSSKERMSIGSSGIACAFAGPCFGEDEGVHLATTASGFVLKKGDVECILFSLGFFCR